MNIQEEMCKDDLCKAIEKYPKKSFEELHYCLCQKGITFNKTTEDEALDILRDVNYYYKLTVYKKNFKKDKDGKYVNLEFSYLTDLASMDMQLRYLLLAATLDIEHALKTYIITKITENDELNGFEIVTRFFHSTTLSEKPLSKESVLENTKSKKHYQYELYKAHKSAPPAWVLVEVMGFGDFLRFFEFYFKKYKSSEFEIESLMGSLNAIKTIRNACAHNNALMFDLDKAEIKYVNKHFKEYAKACQIGEIFYKCNRIHDILSVFFIHEKFVKGKGSRKHRIAAFETLLTNSIERFGYLDSDNSVLYFLKILKKTIDKYVI